MACNNLCPYLPPGEDKLTFSSSLAGFKGGHWVKIEPAMPISSLSFLNIFSAPNLKSLTFVNGYRPVEVNAVLFLGLSIDQEAESKILNVKMLT